MALFGRKKAAEAKAKAEAEAKARAEAEAKAKAEAEAKAKAEAEAEAEADPQLAQAKKVYRGLCHALDKENWKYTKDEENLRVETGARGNDFPMDLYLKVDAERQILVLFSPLPVAVPEDKRIDVAVAVSMVNNQLVDGCFDYNILSGEFFFRMVHGFIDMELGTEFYKYMLYCSCQTIDAYSSKFYMLSKGMLTIEQFLAAETKE